MQDFETSLGSPIPPASKFVSQQFWWKAKNGHVTQLGMIIPQASAILNQIHLLQFLQELNVEGSSVTTLPTSLFDTLLLQVLTLNRNQISSLPNAITQLTALEQLSLGYNYFTEVPQVIGTLPKLRYLDVRKNPFKLPFPPETRQMLLVIKKRGCSIGGLKEEMYMQ